MKILYILLGFVTFSLILCNHYINDTEFESTYHSTAQSHSLSIPSSSEISKMSHSPSERTQSVISSYLTEDKLKSLVLYLDQYRSSESLVELEEKHSMNDNDVILKIIQQYAKNSSVLECLHNCPSLINKDATDLLEAYITEIRYLHQEQFTSELSDILYVISQYRGK